MFFAPVSIFLKLPVKLNFSLLAYLEVFDVNLGLAQEVFMFFCICFVFFFGPPTYFIISHLMHA